MAGWDYAYAVARVRAMETGLLSDADIEQMTGMESVDQVLAFLKERGWGSATEEQDATQILDDEAAKVLAVVKELKVDEETLSIFSFPDAYHNLKTAIKSALTNATHPDAFVDNTILSPENAEKAVRDKDFASLPDHMRLAADEAYNALLHTRDGQLCDCILDRAQLDATLREGKKADEVIIRDYAEMTVALADIRIAARAANTGKSIEFLTRALAPCDSLGVANLARAAASGPDAVRDYLHGTMYSEAADALEESMSAFERWCDNRLMKTIKPQKYVAYTAGPIVAYYIARQSEIRMARIILTAKENKLPEEAIRERMREMYV